MQKQLVVFLGFSVNRHHNHHRDSSDSLLHTTATGSEQHSSVSGDNVVGYPLADTEDHARPEK